MNKTNKYIFLCLFCIHAFICSAQSGSVDFDPTIDSLKKALKNAKHDTTRCEILNELAGSAGDDEWPAFNAQLKKISENNITSATNAATKNFYLKHLANSIINIGYLSQLQGNISEALEAYQKSLLIYEEINNKSGIAFSLNNIAAIYERQGDITKALDYYHKSLKIREELNEKNEIAASLNNIAVVYYSQADYPHAIENLKKSLNIRKKMQDKKGIAIALNNIAGIYQLQGDSSIALNYFNESLKLRQELNDKDGIANSLSNIGLVYSKQGQIEIALSYFQKSLILREEIRDKRGIANSLNNIAGLLLIKKKSAEALKYASRSLQTAKELGFPENILNAEQTLSRIDSVLGNYAGAFEHFKNYIIYRDSINNEGTRKASVKSQLKYEFEKKEAVIKEQQEKERLVAEEKNRFQKIVIWAVVFGLFMVLIFAVFILRSLRITKHQKSIIEEKQKEILDSIHYAKRIQTSMLPTEKYISRLLQNTLEKDIKNQ